MFALLTLCLADMTIGFDGARASSTSAQGNLQGSPAAAAVNAISAGSATWSSAGSHGSGEQVTFEGTLASAASLSGLTIQWVHAPESLRVLTSSDGSATEEAVGWRRTGKEGDAFAETIQFPRSMKAQKVLLAMRSTGGPIAIAELSAKGTGGSIMLISGVTADQEQCAIVENGNQEQGSVLTLQGCLAAQAAGDGRDVFDFEDGQLKSGGGCVVVAAGRTDFGGSVELGSCSSSDGRSSWTLADGHLKTSHGLCLSMKGQLSGADGAKVSASSSADGQSPANVLSQEGSWESATTEGPATLSFEFPDEVRVEELSIEWTKVARSFKVQVQAAGSGWKDFSSSTGNVVSSTTSRGATGLAKRMRIVMTEAAGPNEAFGVRHVTISTAPARLIVQDCDEAALAGDSRSAFFSQQVPEFSRRASASLRSVAPLYHAALEDLSASASKLVDSLPALEKCGKRSFLESQPAASALLSLEERTQGGSGDVASVLDDVYGASMEEYSRVVSAARSVLGHFEK